MTIFFKKNPITNEIREFDNISELSVFYKDWVDATQPEIDAYKLAQLKKDAKPILEKQRKKEQYESITYNGKTYYATPTAQNNLFQAYFIAKELKEPSLNWLDVDNQKVTLTLANALELIKLLRDKTNTLYIQEAEKQNIVKDAVNVSQIEAVLPAGSYTPSMPTNEAPNGAFNTQLEPANGLESGSGELSWVQN